MKFLTAVTFFLVRVLLCHLPQLNASTVQSNFTTSPDIPTSTAVRTTSTAATSSADTSRTPWTSTSQLPLLSRSSMVRDYSWVVVLIVLSSIGILVVVCLEIYIHCKICCTPLLRQWNSLWLGHALLFGIFLSYLLMYAFIPIPCPTTCAIIRFCVGVCYSLCFAVIIVKLVIILCSGSGDIPGPVTVLLFLFVWLVQIVVDMQWLIRDSPSVRRVLTADGFVCDPGFEEHVKSLVYVMVLIAVSLVASFATCITGNDVMDGVLIGLCSGFTIAVWIVWILLGYLKNNTDWHDPCLAFGLLTTATALLVLVAVPKIYQLDRVKESLWDVPPEDRSPEETIATKRENFKGDNDSVHTSVSKRSFGSFEVGSFKGDEKANRGKGQNGSTLMKPIYEETDDGLPPGLDPLALRLQYPTNRSTRTSIRSDSVSGYEGHQQIPTAIIKTKRQEHNGNINYNPTRSKQLRQSRY